MATVMDRSDILDKNMEVASRFGVILDCRVFETLGRRHRSSTETCYALLWLFHVGVRGYSIRLLGGILSIQKTVLKSVPRAHFHKAVSGKWVKKYIYIESWGELSLSNKARKVFKKESVSVGLLSHGCNNPDDWIFSSLRAWRQAHYLVQIRHTWSPTSCRTVQPAFTDVRVPPADLKRGQQLSLVPAVFRDKCQIKTQPAVTRWTAASAAFTIHYANARCLS